MLDGKAASDKWWASPLLNMAVRRIGQLFCKLLGPIYMNLYSEASYANPTFSGLDHACEIKLPHLFKRLPANVSTTVMKMS